MNAETSAVTKTARTKGLGRTRVAVRSTSPAIGSSLAGLYDLWLASWEAALAALTIASQTRALSPTDVAVHRAAIAAERDVVTRQLVLLTTAASARSSVA
jgi:hypothetical protein